MTQLDLMPPRHCRRDSFEQFHRANPHVYVTLRRLARYALGSGVRRIGLRMLWERMRWELSVETTSEDFKLNNNHAPFYARLLMACEPDLAGVFETRERDE